MKLKHQLIIPLLLLFGIAQGQEKVISPATTHGSSIISSIIVYSNNKNQSFFGGSDNPTQVLQVNTSYIGFGANKIGFGGDFGLERINSNNFTITTLQIGPKAGYYFDNGTNYIPYFNVGLSYLFSKADFDDEKDQGLRSNIIGGILFRIGHVALNLEAGYRFDNYGNGDTGNIIFMGIGASACLYPNKEE